MSNLFRKFKLLYLLRANSDDTIVCNYLIIVVLAGKL